MDEPQDRRKAPQNISPGEREEKNRAGEQDLDKSAEGRDVPPEDTGEPKRDPKSPWLGGG